MTFTTRTLLALAAVAPFASALDVKDDDLKVGLKLQLQVRAEKGWSSGTDGNAYNVPEAVANSESDAMDFYVRRARIGFNGTWKGDYKFAYLMRADYQDRSNAAAAPAGAPSALTQSRTPQTHVAYLERVIKQEEKGIEHSVRMGLDYAWFNGPSACFSSTSALLVTDRATIGMLAPRGVGVGYKMTHKMVTWGVDIQNNSGNGTTTGDLQNVAGDGSADQGEGLFIGTRVQVIAYDSEEKGHMKSIESFMGKPGKGLLVSAELGLNDDDNTGANTTVDTTGYGFEILGHMDAITVLAEYRQTIADTNSSTALDDKNVATAYLIQLGYALPMGDKVLEPAIRWTRLNADSDTNESANYGTAEYGASGYTWDLGVNYYLHGYSNKVALAYQHWQGENGGTATVGDAKADTIRFQWGLAF